MEAELKEIDSRGEWQNIYNDIRNMAAEHSYSTAKLPVNKNLNRYRDVSPYDHSRVRLHNFEHDYINASLVEVEEAERAYILTQGPLRNTCSHFWLMVWEQNSKAVIMLNRVIEKGSEKCAQYWPRSKELPLSFPDTGFVVRLLSEEDKLYYTIRVLELQNTQTTETRAIYHFHYTTWPDFGVPESPACFLNFLFKVRESGSLGSKREPSVVHCSAGIGRSGTLALVDTCLVLMERRRKMSLSDMENVLLDMRYYRMGLIQTPDQLRFSFMAINEGAKVILSDNSTTQKDSRPNGPCLEPQAKAVESDNQDHLMAHNSVPVRKRQREMRNTNTAKTVQEIKQKMSDSERKREQWQYWRPILLNIGAGAALAVGLLCWMYTH
uniref:Tyrosine-protein phosphatase non-receptor type n=4 Tax=Nothobranchius TaxID=28779 RepID=A0A1A8QG78_9TELE